MKNCIEATSPRAEASTASSRVRGVPIEPRRWRPLRRAQRADLGAPGRAEAEGRARPSRAPTPAPGGTLCLLFCSLSLLAGVFAGCSAEDDCEKTSSCPSGHDARTEGSPGAGGAAGSDAQGGGYREPEARAEHATATRKGRKPRRRRAEDTAPFCDNDASPYAAPCNMNGVFVSPLGSNANTGAKDKPVATIEKALTVDNPTRRIYVCAPAADAGLASDRCWRCRCCSGLHRFDGPRSAAAEPPHLGRLRLHELDLCRPTRVKTEAGKTPLAISGASGLTIEGFDFEASDGEAAGHSSIAAFVQASTDVTLRKVTLKAGKGHRGADGESPSPNYSGDAHAGGDANGTSGGNACENTCANRPSAVSSRGGKGGSVIAADSGADAGGPEPGEDGTPAFGATSDPDGKGGTEGRSCGAGGTGHDGASAPPANGGTGARIYGTLTTSGWMPADGNAGETGKPGQGGGGGAAAKTPSPGGGGGGGCGGCGGTGGTAGKGGGSSFALLSLTSTITLEACTLSAAEAGAGGNGAAGQDGQVGGLRRQQGSRSLLRRQWRQWRSRRPRRRRCGRPVGWHCLQGHAPDRYQQHLVRLCHLRTRRRQRFGQRRWHASGRRLRHQGHRRCVTTGAVHRLHGLSFERLEVAIERAPTPTSRQRPSQRFDPCELPATKRRSLTPHTKTSRQ